jgi:peptide/nickel transport system substrate-binding protein
MTTTQKKSNLKYVGLGVAILIVLVGAYFLTTPQPTPPKPTTTTATTRPPAAPTTLTIAMGTEAPTLDPQRATGMPNLGIIRLITETLTDADWRTGELLPNLAERWDTTPDATTWTLYLRQGVKFHDGTPFNATAVKFTYDRMMDPKVGAAVGGAYAMIKSVDIKDTYTVVFKTEAHPPFLRLLWYGPFGIVSPTQVKKLGDDFTKVMAGTGPYKLVEFVRGSHIKLAANDQYWGGRPKIDTLISKPIAEGGARLMALEAGEVDFVYQVPPADIPRLEKNPNIQMIYGIPTRAMHVPLNTQWGPLKDKKVRQALNYAVDKNAINQRIFKGLAAIMDCPVNNKTFGYYKVGPYPYDPAKAKQLLSEAGYANGFEVNLRYGKGRWLMGDDVVEALQSYLAAVGVKVKIEGLEWAAYRAKESLPFEKTDAQMSFAGLGGITLDADRSLNELRKAAWPPAGLEGIFYDNPKFDELFQKARSTANEQERIAYYKEAIQIIWEDAPRIFLYFEPQLYASRKTVSGVGVRHDETIWVKGATVQPKGAASAASLFQLMPILRKDLEY